MAGKGKKKKTEGFATGRQKTAAFLTALVLFAGTVLGIHFGYTERISEGPGFDSWVNPFKDASYSSLSANVHEDTVLLMGSSEFNHAREQESHPTKVFRGLGKDVMIVGSADSQSLINALTLAAVGDEMRGGKAVLILSPTWFMDDGMTSSRMDHRYSESLYLAMLKEDALPKDLRSALRDRVVELLPEGDKKERAVSYGKCYLDEEGAGHPLMRGYAGFRAFVLNERERISVNIQWIGLGKREAKRDLAKTTDREPDWQAMESDALAAFPKISAGNAFHMKDSIYRKRIAPVMKEKKDSMTARRYRRDCPELDDLDLFLKVAAAYDIEVELILTPLNGKWYDYCGFTKEKRDVLPGLLAKRLADRKGVTFVDLSDRGDEPGFLEDWCHPGGAGWAVICHHINDFVEKKEPADGSVGS